MTDFIKPSKLKKDYITGIAILLFVSLLLLEIFLSTFLVKQLSQEKLWEKEIAFTEIGELTDSLRQKLETGNFSGKEIQEEVLLMSECVDVIAEYLKKNTNTISRQQIRELRKDLDSFEKVSQVWINKKVYKNKEELDLSKYIDELKLKK